MKCYQWLDQSMLQCHLTTQISKVKQLENRIKKDSN